MRRAKQPWLRGFLRLDYGVASPDTFERVFALLDPKQFEQAFRTWVRASSRRWVKTHMFFDDQETHVQAASSVVPAGKVPYEGGSLRAANRKTSTDQQKTKAEIKE